MGNWVDFSAVKAAVSMEAVLTHYQVKLRKVNATSLRGKCPLPSHGASGGNDKGSFGVQLLKNAWACHSASCVAARQGSKGGNQLDFVAAMEGCSVRDAALKLQEWFMIPAPTDGAMKETVETPVSALDRNQGGGVAHQNGENPALTFTLKGIDCSHPYLTKRGIKQGTAEDFGVGYFAGKGSMSERIVFPMANAKGELVGYAGRSIDGTEPEYKFPAGFKKSLVLYNLHRAISAGREKVILVEGFFDTMKVHQAGYPYVVGLLGCYLSDQQAQLLRSHFAEVVIMLDGNDPGRRGAAECAVQVAPVMRTKFVWVPWEKEPDRLSSEEIRSLLD